MKSISIVIPVFNEQAGIEEFHYNIIAPEIEKLQDKSNFSIVYVNDGSRDDSLKLLQSIASKDDRVSVVSLSRNFGKEIATTAGIHAASGSDAVVCLDADGQHPPALLGDFIAKWEAGAKVVVGVRESNQNEGFVKKQGSKLFYRLFNSFSGSRYKMVPRSTDFRLIDKLVVAEFLHFTERNRITRGLIDWLGFKTDYIYFDSPERLAGKATYKTSDLAALAINSFISLSTKPLLISGYIGAFIFIVSVIAGLFIIIEQYLMGDPLGLDVTGAAQLGIFLSCLVGIVLISQSIMSIYLSHIHTQTQGRPLFVIDKSESVNLRSDDK